MLSSVERCLGRLDEMVACALFFSLLILGIGDDERLLARLVRERTSRYPCFSVCTSLPALVPLYGQTVWVVFFSVHRTTVWDLSGACGQWTSR